MQHEPNLVQCACRCDHARREASADRLNPGSGRFWSWSRAGLSSLLCVFAACLLSNAALAAPLALPEALALAVDTHPSVAARQSSRDAAQQRVKAAEWSRYPALSAQHATDPQDRRSTTVRVEQPLWTGGQITGQIDGARAGLGAAQAAVVESQQEIMTRVAVSFTEYGRVRARQKAAQSNVSEHERLAALIARRVDSQINPPSDAVLAQARLAQARAELSQLDALAARARTSLEQAVGRPVEEIVLPERSEPAYTTLAALTEAALAFSPALARLAGEEEQAGAEIQVRRGATRPRVVARYDHTFGHQELESNHAYVAVEYQLGAGLSAFASVAEAEARRRAAQLARESARRDLLDALGADWGDLQSLRAQGRDLRAQVETTTSVFDSFVRQYAVGRKSWIEVLNAQREAAQARYALADAEWGGLRAALRLKLASGELTAQSVLSPSAH